MSRDHWDAILASTPLNATAGRVTSKGQHFEGKGLQSEISWEVPPALMKIGPTHWNNPSFIDWTGKAIGRLTVLGLAADGHREGMGGVWVCRCSCGRFVGRRAKGLKIERADTVMCNQCSYTQHLRYSASGDRARHRAESEKARKWTAA